MPDITTVTAIEQQLIPIIQGITPHATDGQDDGWVYEERAEKASFRTRRFRLEWRPLGMRDDGFFTNAAVQTDVMLDVVTDYAIPEDRAFEIVESDRDQLFWKIHQELANPGNTAKLLVSVEAGDFSDPELSQEGHADRFQATHTFTLSYLKTRSYT